MVKRLPDAEFEVMRVIWRSDPPITTAQIMKVLEPYTNWKPQTVMTMLVRLIEKNFLTSERVGRERSYAPIVTEQEYMRAETEDFLARYRGNSIGSLVKTLYEGENLSSDDIMEIKQWLKEKEG